MSEDKLQVALVNLRRAREHRQATVPGSRAHDEALIAERQAMKDVWSASVPMPRPAGPEEHDGRRR